jgi:FAD:protein FMN transferase
MDFEHVDARQPPSAVDEAPTRSDPGPETRQDRGQDAGQDAGQDTGPDAGPGAEPDAGPGAEPDVRLGMRPDVGSGMRPDVGSGMRPDVGSGMRPDAGHRPGPDAGIPGLRRVQQITGMPVTLDIRDALPAATLDELAERVFDWLRTVDALFSSHWCDSQISLLDQGMLRAGQAHPLVREVLNSCARLNERTEGYFDVHATGRLDLSGYVKGWALQRAAALLTEAGAGNFQIRAGGDAYAAGHPEPGRPWRIAVHDPFQPRSVAWVVPATDLGVATSDGHADYEHIQNPWTRNPASGLASVTVAGPDLGIADAYATAAYAMGSAAHDWLAGLSGEYAFALIDDEGRRFHGWLPGLVLAA